MEVVAASLEACFGCRSFGAVAGRNVLCLVAESCCIAGLAAAKSIADGREVTWRRIG